MDKEEIEKELREIFVNEDEELDKAKVFEILEVLEVIGTTGNAYNPYSRTLTSLVSTERNMKIKQLLGDEIDGVNLDDFSYKMLTGIDAHFAAQEVGATMNGQTVDQVYVGKKLNSRNPYRETEIDNVNEMNEKMTAINESEEKKLDEKGIVLLKLKDGEEITISGVTGRQVIRALGEKEYEKCFFTYKEIREIHERQKELKEKDEQISELESQKDDLSNKVKKKNETIERLQEMLSITLNFATKVRNSILGKIFFKKSIDELQTIDGELPEGNEKQDKNIAEK